jgi:hypothetical protein
MEFRILGPLEVLGDERRVAVGGDKQRALLALLLIHANQTLSSERLIDELWGEQPPASAPSLSTSGETLTIEESMTLRARSENRQDVGRHHERGWSGG